MRDKENEKSFKLLAHLDGAGATLEFFFEKFTVNGAISENRKDLTMVKETFLERVAMKEEPQNMIKGATDAALAEKDLVSLLQRLKILYQRNGFNDEARFGFWRAAATDIPPLATFFMYQSASTYKQLTLAVSDFDCGTRAFQAGPLKKHIAD